MFVLVLNLLFFFLLFIHSFMKIRRGEVKIYKILRRIFTRLFVKIAVIKKFMGTYVFKIFSFFFFTVICTFS